MFLWTDDGWFSVVWPAGAIHTIPAPNLSLSEKPIVVIDSENLVKSTSDTVSKNKQYLPYNNVIIIELLLEFRNTLLISILYKINFEEACYVQL